MAETGSKNDSNASPTSSSSTSTSSSERNQSLASAAQSIFEKGDYGAALKALRELELSKSSDLKLTQNIALTEFYHKTSAEDLQKTLLVLYSQVLGEGEVEKACLVYNLALLQYWRRNYHVALQMLTKIYALVDQLEEQLSLAICFLLAEVNLRVWEPTDALHIVQFIETSLLGRGAKLGSSLTLEQKEKSPKSGEEGQLPDVLRVRLQKLKIRAYLMTKQVEQAELEYSGLENLASGEPHTLLLRARLDALQNQTCMPLPQHLTNLSSDSEGECWTAVRTAMLARNYFGQKKPYLAALHFKQAWQQYQNHIQLTSSTKIDSISLAAWGHSYESAILHGLGLALLQCKQAVHAFDCLLAVVQRESALKPLGQAKLWLRLAECCIMNQPKEEQFKPIQVVGSGLLRTARIPVQKPYTESGDHAAIPVPTLEFGALCLRNAEILLGKGVKEDSSFTAIYHTVLCNQAYVALCLGDLVFALEKARLLLSKTQLSHTQKLLGHMYAAEALLLLNRVEEAQAYVDVPLDFLLENGGTSGLAHFPALLVWKYNLACVLAARQNYRGALEHIIQVMENCNLQKLPSQVNALAVFLQLKLGQADQARHLLQMQCAQLR